MYAVIMAGGSGTRFWPLSREKNPKQVLRLTGDDTLIEKTVDRVLPVIKPEDIFIVTVVKQRRKILSLLPQIPSENIIAEPYARNTAPAIGLAALHVKQRDPEGIMVVLPADHLVSDVSKFCKIINKGEDIVRSTDKLVTLGLKPHYPETGFGYIQAGSEIKSAEDVDGNIAREIKRFTEKPDIVTAREFVTRPDYYWNGGIFIWKAETIMNEIKAYLPDIWKGFVLIERSIGKRSEKQVLSRIYKSFQKISIDNGVMEKTDRGVVIPSDIGWNDVGSWLALDSIGKKDERENSVVGKFIGLDSENCIIHDSRGLVALIGMKDIIVVSTPDAVLVCPKEKSQEVREMVNLLREKGFGQYL